MNLDNLTTSSFTIKYQYSNIFQIVKTNDIFKIYWITKANITIMTILSKLVNISVKHTFPILKCHNCFSNRSNFIFITSEIFMYIIALCFVEVTLNYVSK